MAALRGSQSTLLCLEGERVDERLLLDDVLKGVSRSFYLSIRVLPRGMRKPVALAYLLARAADTIADTRALPPAVRLERLLAIRARLRGPGQPHDFGAVCDSSDEHDLGHGISADEATLLRIVPQLLQLLNTLSEADREQVKRAVTTLSQGMELDLITFPPEDSGSVASLTTPERLDRYTYLVAGCVGEFWTAVTMTYERRLAHWGYKEMSALGVRFGKALQLTNVLRDVPRDLRSGRCYLPASDLEAQGLSPTDLLDSTNGHRARQVLVRWIQRALDHFEAAEAYLLALPRRCVRLRLAALWPILLGLATLEILARNHDWLDPAHPSRVRRRWVYGMMARSIVVVSSDTLLRFWIRRLRRNVERALDG